MPCMLDGGAPEAVRPAAAPANAETIASGDRLQGRPLVPGYSGLAGLEGACRLAH